MPIEPDSSDSGSSGKAWRNPAVIAAVIAAVGAVIAAAVTGFFGLLSSTSGPPSDPSTPSAAACSGFRADVDIPSQPGPTPTLTINLNCPPAQGQRYMWVIEADGIGKDNHAEYYPKQFSSDVRVGVPFNTTLDLHGDKIGQQNCIYVISVTTQQYENIESNLNGNNLTLHLPEGIDHVSARACEKRAY